MIRDWAELKAFAQSLDLPRITLEHPWGNEALKAHGRMWCWWSPFEDAAVFRAARDEREMLMEADTETFFLHPHYRNHDLVLVRAGRIDPDWARPPPPRAGGPAAPRGWVREWDAAHPLSSV